MIFYFLFYPFFLFLRFTHNKHVLCYSLMKRTMLFYNKYIKICPDKTNTIRNQNLLNRIMLNSWQGLVTLWVSTSHVPFVNQQQYKTTRNVWYTIQVLFCLVTVVTHPLYSYVVFSNVLHCSFSFYNLTQSRAHATNI